jgi:hypothetical protein
MTKTTSVVINAALYARAEAAAKVEGVSVDELAAKALAEHLSDRELLEAVKLDLGDGGRA